MRTTVNINDSLLAQVKERASRQGRSIGDVIDDAIRETIAREGERVAATRKVEIITFRGNGVRPGVHLDNMSELLDVMDAIS
jgi:hypothetical protein